MKKPLIDTVCDLVSSAIVKVYHLKPGNVVTKRIRNEVGWGLELLDVALDKMQRASFQHQVFFVGQKALLMPREYGDPIREVVITDLPKGKRVAGGFDYRVDAYTVTVNYAEFPERQYRELALPHELRRIE